jgi:hypothetical protein
VQGDLNKIAAAVDRMRSLKKQIAARNDLLKDVAKAKDLIEDSKKFVTKLDALEERLHNPKAEVTYDILAQKGGARLLSQLATLLEWLSDSDGPITQGVTEVYAEHTKDLAKVLGEWRDLVGAEVARLNRVALALEVPTLFVLPEPGSGKRP